MSRVYHKIPLNIGDLLEKKDLPSCSLKESIAQNIYLLVTTKLGECRYDYTYGCELWDMDFELITNENKWTEKVTKSLEESLKNHENRLYQTKVEVLVSEQILPNISKNIVRVKKKLDINVKGMITETREEFFYNQSLFLSPISID
jgi:phage baseplate assembly protein W